MAQATDLDPRLLRALENARAKARKVRPRTQGPYRTADGRVIYQVDGSDGRTLYTVTVRGARLMCSCPAMTPPDAGDGLGERYAPALTCYHSQAVHLDIAEGRLARPAAAV